MPDPLVFLSQRELDVDRCKQGEDVCLKHSNQDFESREDETESKRSKAECLPRTVGLKQEERGGGEAQNQEQVASNHVHQKTKGQRDGAQDEDREELNRSHDEVDRPGHSGWEERVLQECTGVLLQTCVDEGDIGNNGQSQWQTNQRRTSNVESRENTRDVHGQNGEEDGGQQWKEALSVLLAQQVFSNVDANNVQCHFCQRLSLGRNKLHVARAQPEQQDQHRSEDETNQDDSVDLKRGSCEEDRGWEEFGDRGPVKARVALCRGDERGYSVY